MTSPTQPTLSRPPPLPPRQSEPSITAITAMTSRDPRSSSTQSLVPDPASDHSGLRRLLLVYIHGFQGNETSFRSFPAHLHNVLTITLAESHSVHTKIYPKYRSRNAIEVARDDFSNWLTPHETPWTDIVLLGHSMGGLVAADIALLFRHNIIGIVNFDVPFLGMHPGIVKAGLGSIFKPWPAPEDQTLEQPEGKRPSRMDTLFNPRPMDPNYNPSFSNDVQLPVRKGWENTLHFINKHSNGLIAASKGLVKSHVEFGRSMADYPELKARYARIRALEEDNEGKRKSANPGAGSPPRIRFVNYYTASTGRPKKPKSPKSPSPSRSPGGELEHPNDSTASFMSSSQAASHKQTLSTTTTHTASPRISVEEHRGDKVVPVNLQEPLSATSPTNQSTALGTSSTEAGPVLPDIPPIPPEPPFVDLAQYPDKAERRAAEKEHTKALKDYQRAVKARNAVIKERSKIEERWQKQKQKEEAGMLPKEEKSDSDHEPDDVSEGLGNVHIAPTPGGHIQSPQNTNPYSNYDFSRSVILAQPNPDDRPSIAGSVAPSTQGSYADSMHTLTTQDTNDHAPHDSSPSASPKKKRYKKFCVLPPKDVNGNKDPTWIRVFMENMDEVIAHTSLFFVNETYEMLVGDVAARVEDWVREVESVRLVQQMEGL
ncbi:hypothetical protein K491DRAFT_692184 [Lophiostoma macrostomum CBS 122681]|uniref:AB hydrolase-1 domain-containing protein n=1 Tax=Lophiostoma macrostomum CBS 122681 TaxID=1314788 RepID=A0A6A6TA88_9PLEO|nr:hypothetical protein K491DRAFT_692184 [Lophiostoma macrostomum CBS 122681]